ncbi:rhodanese-like domain-containing protein [Geothrix oryzisoli]|uniref:rhodanese-like domain-containing protein n=1 Tax=Geothrix oryzisoli TaxID=2922721 RepID=UPI001FACC714|nr:rhodanese-like domain-containing protein [Geothrix oryzisoli]
MPAIPQNLTTLKGWMEAYPFLPGLVFAALCLVLLVAVALPRLRSWARGKDRPVLDPLQVEELLQGPGVLIVDLRDEGIYRRGHIRGCLHVPFAQLTQRFQAPDPKARRALVLVDETDALSHRALTILLARGFEWVYVLKGGMRAWRDANRPMVK